MKKLFIITLLVSGLFVLSSCWEELAPEEVKKDFVLETQDFKDFWFEHNIEKTGRISSEQNISLNSKVLWEVSSIAVKSWDTVKKWQPLMYISDSVSNYSGNLNSASIWVESSKINYESQEISLTKAVADTKLNLERTKTNFDISKAQIEEDMKQAKINFENSKLSSSDSSSSLQLQKLEESIAKAEFDYNNLLIQNTQQVQTFISNSRNEYNSLLNLYTDVIEFSDTVLGVTDKNDDKNDSFETFLGASNKTALTQSKTKFHELQKYKEYLLTIDTLDIEEESMDDFLNQFADGHELLTSFLNIFEETLIESIDSIGFNRQGFISQTNGYQTQVQWGKTQFLATKNAIGTFLATYKLSEQSSKKQVELLYTDLEITKDSLGDGEEIGEITYKKTVLALEDQLSALETGLKNAQLTYDNAVKQKDITLKSLNNQIKNAQNSYSSALKEYQKLTIVSPIDGVVWSISAQQWQEISQWTPLLSLSNIARGEVKVFLSKEELDLVTEWQEVSVSIDGNKVKGELISISRIANGSLNYEGSILVDDKVNIIGSIVEVSIPVTFDVPLFPVKIIETIWNGKAQVKVLSGAIIAANEDQEATLSGATIENTVIELGKIWGNNIEVTSVLSPDTKIILSEVGNFDPQKFKLQSKQSESGE